LWYPEFALAEITMHYYQKLMVAGLLLWSTIGALQAQKTITDDEQLWFAGFNQTRLSTRWGIWFDTHLRWRDNFISQPSLYIVRGGPTYYLSDDVRLTAAYGLIGFFPTEAHPEITRYEHRPWQQIQWFSRLGKTRLVQSVRLEERFRRKLAASGTLAEGYDFNWRTRINAALFMPLGKKGLGPGSVQGVVNNELMVNFGQQVRYNYFDQNRLFVGLAFQFTALSQLQLGYMHVFVQQAAGDRFNSIHTLRAFYVHNLDFRTPQE